MTSTEALDLARRFHKYHETFGDDHYKKYMFRVEVYSALLKLVELIKKETLHDHQN